MHSRSSWKQRRQDWSTKQVVYYGCYCRGPPDKFRSKEMDMVSFTDGEKFDNRKKSSYNGSIRKHIRINFLFLTQHLKQNGRHNERKIGGQKSTYYSRGNLERLLHNLAETRRNKTKNSGKIRFCIWIISPTMFDILQKDVHSTDIKVSCLLTPS